jgi:hypothetical protein
MAARWSLKLCNQASRRRQRIRMHDRSAIRSSKQTTDETGLYSSTPPYRSKQKQDLYDLPRERRFIPAEPFKHISIEIDQALETKRQDSRRIEQRVART